MLSDKNIILYVYIDTISVYVMVGYDNNRNAMSLYQKGQCEYKNDNGCFTYIEMDFE